MLNLQSFAKGDLDHLLGEVEAKGESAPESKEEEASLVINVEPLATPVPVVDAPHEDEKEDVTCREKNNDVV
ncbi:UNVERIFIED_CONTAM: hypothetical protein Sindi_1250900 [Sesamum indicum]